MLVNIKQKLQNAFAPLHLEVVDESHKHQGHAGWREGQSTHFHVTIVSNAFSGHSKISRHRMVYDVLSEELKAEVHALAIVALTPDEASAKRPA